MMYEILQLLPLTLLLAGLVALMFFDIKEGVLPDVIIFPLAVLGFIYAALSEYAIFFVPRGIGIWDSLIGALTGLLLLAAVYYAGKKFMGREVMGLGDVKFMAMAGAWVGWQGLNAVLIGGALLSIIFYVALRPFRGTTREIPFGPGLCIALGAVAILNQLGIEITPAILTDW